MTSEMQRLVSLCSNLLLFSFHGHSEAGIEKGPADTEKQIHNPVPWRHTLQGRRKEQNKVTLSKRQEQKREDIVLFIAKFSTPRLLLDSKQETQ